MFSVLIAKDQATINKIINLRYQILRKPWNKPIETVTDEFEFVSINAYIEDDEKIIAAGRLQDNGNGTGQVRYMAVDNTYQGKGLGKLILKKLEAKATEMNMHTVELQARENALEFYKANGYRIVEKSFCLWDIIQHYLMAKTLINDSLNK